MSTPNIEAIVRATIEQLTKQKEPETDDGFESFRQRQERRKMKRFQKEIGKA